MKPFIPSYVKDGDQVLEEILLRHLPDYALLFVTDANAMYNNIDTAHAILVITRWLKDLHTKGELPPNFPLKAVVSAMIIIMRNNIFEFGDYYFLQLLGTAMGTSAAVMWATLYYAYHEVHTIIPNHGYNFVYYIQYIDDVFAILIGNLTSDWDAFSKDINNFGVLTWDINEVTLVTSVNFLDMTLTIENQIIVTRTFQKKMNLHFYIPPISEHAPGCIRGTIFGLIGQYYKQNTYCQNFVHFSSLLYKKLLDRGWHRELICGLILEANTRAENKPTERTPKKEEDLKDIIFLHFTFHKDGIS